MRDAARPGRKRWALSNWALRWKVTAVLVVPLLVAVVLGASRIAAQFSDSSDLAAAVQHVGTIPAVTGLSGAQGTVAGEQMIQIGPNQSLVQDADLTALDNAISAAEKAADRLSGLPNARSSLEQMVAGAKAIRAAGKSPAKTVQDALNQEEAIRQNSVRTAEAITGAVSDAQVEQTKLRLVDALNTRAVLVSQTAAMGEALRGNPKDGLRDDLTATTTERQLLGAMAHRFPDNDPTIADLTNLVNNRIQLLSSPQIASGQIPLQDLRQSVLDSLADYQKIVDQSTSDINSRVNTLADGARADAIRYAAIVIVTILAALLLAVLIARSLIVPLRKLRLAALRVAEHDLGHEVSRLRDGASPEDVPLEPMPVHTDEEVGQLARAVDDIHGQALRLAADQASMRTQVNDMFETLARRSKSLVDHQLSLIEAMEYDEKDPRLLENLFRLDHLAARMRRNGDNLLILAGTRQRRNKSAPVEIADVLRAAISEVEDYERVKLGATPRGAITEPAASDLAHLFAELLDNALRASPPETDVKFTFAQAHDQGLLIEVADRGIGMPPVEMTEINRRLESAAEVGPDTARHMGLFVVGRLAERHGLTVRLRSTFDTARDPGVTVTVHLPKALIVAPGGAVTVPPQPNQPAPTADAEPQRPAAPAPMQTRAVTRTPSGNMMVTVDPGVSGPIQRPAAASAGAGANGATTVNGSSAPPSGSLPQRPQGPVIGLPQRQPGVNGPTVRHTVERPADGDPQSPGLPQRDPGANRPQAPSVSQPGVNLPPRRPGDGGFAGPQPGLAANMLRRQPGTANQPPPGGPGTGLPQRQPGGNAQPPRDPAHRDPVQRDPVQRDPGAIGSSPAGTGLPPRGNGTGSLPRRSAPNAPGTGGIERERPVAGLPPREPGGPGLPTREPGASSGLPTREPGAAPGLPPRDPGAGGLPQRQPGVHGPTVRRNVAEPPANGAPSGPGGLPQRGSNGVPQRDSGLPPRDPVRGAGLPPRDPTGSGLPLRDPSTGGLPQREPGIPPREPDVRGLHTGGLPQREPGSTAIPAWEPGPSGPLSRESGGVVPPQRDVGLPGREPGGSGLPQRDPSAGGPPKHGAGASGLPQRDQSVPRLPQQDLSASGLPQRDPSAAGLPQRDPSAAGLPQREQSSGALPQRDSSSGGLPQREPSSGGLPLQSLSGSGLPQRDPSATGVPQRGLGAFGLPRREPGSAGAPPVRQPGTELPQRGTGSTGLPPRDSAPTVLPRREPGGTTGLPRRDPAGSGLPQRDPSVTGLPQREQRNPAGTGLPQRGPGLAGLPQRDPGAGLPPRPQPTPGVSLPRAAGNDALSGDLIDPDGREGGRHSSHRSNAQKTAAFFQSRLQPAEEAGPVVGTPIFSEMMSAWLSDPDADRSQAAAAFESPGDEGWQAARHAVEASPEKRTAAGLPQRDPGSRLVPGGVIGQPSRTANRDPASIRSSLSRHQQGVRDGRAMRAINLTGEKGDR